MLKYWKICGLMLILAVIATGARYIRESNIPIIGPGGMVYKGDTVTVEDYKAASDTVAWTFLDHTGGVDIFTSTIITTTPGSFDTVDVDIATAVRFYVWALDSAVVFINDTSTTGLRLYYGGWDSALWRPSILKKVDRLIIGGIDSTTVTVQIWTE